VSRRLAQSVTDDGGILSGARHGLPPPLALKEFNVYVDD
jgi:hypothetical protein